MKIRSRYCLHCQEKSRNNKQNYLSLPISSQTKLSIKDANVKLPAVPATMRVNAVPSIKKITRRPVSRRPLTIYYPVQVYQNRFPTAQPLPSAASTKDDLPLPAIHGHDPLSEQMVTDFHKKHLV